jgi:hypothetical protein
VPGLETKVMQSKVQSADIRRVTAGWRRACAMLLSQDMMPAAR